MTVRIASEADALLETRGRWQRRSLPPALGPCHTDRLDLAPGLALLHSRYRPGVDLAESSQKALPQPVLTVTLGLQGASAFCEQGGQTLDFASGRTTVTGFAQAHGQRRYRAGVAVRQLRVQASLDLLQTYVGAAHARRLLAHGRVRQLACHDSTPVSLAHARALLWQAEHAPEHLLALHASALGLLCEALRAMGAVPSSAPSPAAGPLPSTRDAAKLGEARRWLETRADQPANIRQLASQLGWSESRLRRAFYAHYGQSPQAFHMQVRMHKARQLLQAGCRVAEAAYQLGYEHPANFSLAFTRYFGYAPKRARNLAA
ncbi:AraC family transcriptional regulator [Comamonadaceae bacterium OH2545_COT-014]|nr:AraC family transcriptional regulator [Comamonadaceae bacterium OH2545_COT-014]